MANIGTTIYWVILFALTPIVYFCGMWRAKQLQWVIEYVKAGAIEPLPEAHANEAAARA